MPRSSSRRKPKTPFSFRSIFFAILDFVGYAAVLFAGGFLIVSFFIYFSHSLSLVIPSYYVSRFHSTVDYWTSEHHFHIICFALLSIVYVGVMGFLGQRSRRCGIDGCRGRLKAPEFDLRRLEKNEVDSDLEKVELKGDGPGRGFYECLRVELRRLAPAPGGRAVLLFCKGCGCPVSKIVVLKDNSTSARRQNRNQARSSGSER